MTHLILIVHFLSFAWGKNRSNLVGGNRGKVCRTEFMQESCVTLAYI